jgi:putative inorganic carbon (HCO3(-)) transporter
MQNALKLKEFVHHKLIFFIVLEIAIGLTAIVLPLKIALILLLGLPVVLLLLLRPFYAYLLGIILLPIWTLTLTGAEEAGKIDFRFADVAFILAAIGLLVKMALDKDFTFRGSSLDFPMVLFFAWMGISFIWATSFTASLVDFVKKLEGLAIFYLTVNFARRREDLNTILIVWIITGLVTSLFGLYELMTTGLKFAESLAVKVVITHWGEPVRTSAYAEGPNKLAFALGISLLLAFSYYGINKKPWTKRFIFLAIIVMLIVLISTLSRTGWIAFFLSLLFLFLVAPKTRKPVITLAVTGIVAFLLFTTTAYWDILYQRFLGIIFPLQTQDFPGRTEVWGLGLKMFSEKPLTGVGVGSFHQLAIAYGETNLEAPHNLFIYVISEFGIVGIGLFIFLIASLISETIRVLRRITDKREKLILLGIISAMVLYSLQGMVTSFRLRENNMWAVLGLLFASIRIYTSNPELVSQDGNVKPQT